MLFQGILGHSKPTHSSWTVKHKETENILKLAELLRIVVISGKMSCHVPVTTNAPQRPFWGPHSCIFLITTQGMGQITLSANHSKGPQQAGEMGKQESHETQQRKVQSPTLRGITLFTSTDWGTDQLQSSLADNNSKPWATTCPCSKEVQQSPGLHWKKHCQQAEGGDSSTLLSPCEMQLKCWSSLGLSSPIQKWAYKSESI